MELFLCLIFSLWAEGNGNLGRIDVVLCADDALGGPIAVLLTSMFENANQNTFYHVRIQIPGSFNPEVKEKIGYLKEKYKNCQIDFIDMGRTFYVVSGKFPPSSNFYLLAARLFPEIKKIIYLDGDIIVRHDLSQLFETNIEDYYCAGVHDTIASSEKEQDKELRLKAVNIPDFKQYINAGVVLLNLERIREDKLEGEFLKFLESEKENIGKKVLFIPQDILNRVCYGKILLLPLKFNLMINLIRHKPYEESAYAKMSATVKDWEEAKDPTIVHFACNPKPWDKHGKKSSRHEKIVFQEEWKTYAKKTAFYEMKDKEKKQKKGDL